MLCTPIVGPSYSEALDQIELASPLAELVEFRFDLFKNLQLEEIRNLVQKCPLPSIFTLRPKSQGGSFSGLEEERLNLIRELAELGPDYFDFEYTIPNSYVNEFQTKYPAIKIISSYHDFDKTPENLKDILEFLKKQGHGHLYKISTMTHSSLDSLRLLLFQKENGKGLSVMGMGVYGDITRILGTIFGSMITYASLSEKYSTAPGQVDVETLINTYHIKLHTPDTEIFALFGHPVNTSLGHIIHNALIEAFDLDGVYIKIDIPPKELQTALKLAQMLNFKGLSITMPLKEHIIKWVRNVQKDVIKIRASNTILIRQNQTKAFNTDGFGALQAIEEFVPVKDKRIIILGAGGAAKAIVHESLNRGAYVVILNRSIDKAQELAQSLGCKSDSLDQMEKYFTEGYDILINCTPLGMPIKSEHLIAGKLVMDIVTYPKNTELLTEASRKGCHLVYGYQMWIYQAIKQIEIWHGSTFDPTLAKETAEKLFKTYL